MLILTQLLALGFFALGALALATAFAPIDRNRHEVLPMIIARGVVLTGAGLLFAISFTLATINVT